MVVSYVVELGIVVLRLLIGAVNKRMSTLELKFFTNYLDNEGGDSKYTVYRDITPFIYYDIITAVHVWKVARYTCSSPFYFGECDHYVDTSVLCKNLCGIGLEKISSYYKGFQQDTADPITMVVSLGDGIMHPQQLGFADSSAAAYLSGQPRVNTGQLLELFRNVVALYSNAAVSNNNTDRISHC